MTLIHRSTRLRFRTLLLCFLSGLAILHAGIPQAAKDDPRYKLGYLVVTYYPRVDPTGAEDSLSGLQAAVDDAYANGLVTLFPTGIYVISNTLRCRAFHLTTGTNTDGSVKLGTNPCQTNTFILQGSRLGSRPVLKLAASPSADFDDTANVRPVLLFRLYQSTAYPNEPTIDPPESSPLAAPSGYKIDSSYLFNWELRDLEVDCGGHAGAVGVVFPAAQGSLIANARVQATGAFAGIYGLPGRNWGAVNLEVEGGRYGIRTGGPTGSSCAGSSLFGVRLVDQTVTAIDHEDFAPLIMAGFQIRTPSTPALSLKSNYTNYTAFNTMTLLDGSIQVTGAPSAPAAISNSTGKNLYVRNVFVGGATSLVQSASLPALGGTGTWSRIDEYSYTDQRTLSPIYRFPSYSLIDGVTNTTAERVKTATLDSGPPPGALLTRHLPAHGFPQYEGTGSLPTIVVTDPPYNAIPGDALDDTASIQQAIDDASAAGHGRVFIPKFDTSGSSPGAFRLTNTLTLRKNTVLFGAAKAYVSELRTHPTWRPTTPVSLVQTEDDPSATTFLGNLALATDISLYRSPFTFYHWRAGAASGTGNLRLETVYEFRPPENPNQYTGVLFSGNAGGRHFFFPAAELDKVGNTAGPYPYGNLYRSLKITGTSQPLWLYGFNLEGGKHDLRSYDVEILDSSNIRWLGWKREGNSSMLRLSNTQNFALYSAGAMREPIPEGNARFEITGNSNHLLMANVLVQQDDNADPPTSLVSESITGQPATAVAYPANVSLYQRGTIDDEAMRAGVPLPLPVLRALSQSQAGFRLSLNGVGGYRYPIETSDDLIHWTSWDSATALDGVSEIVDPDSSTLARFYRCVLP